MRSTGNARTLPLSESSELSPMSPYAVGKLMAENICAYWAGISDYKIIVARPFTHIGPGQSDRFSISSFAKQIAQIKSGFVDTVIKVGNLDTTRDFTDVRDIVSAYWLLLAKGESGETYNICSGTERSIKATLVRMIELSGIDISIEVDNARLRAVQQKRSVGNPEKVKRLTSWECVFTPDETLENMISHWMGRVSI